MLLLKNSQGQLVKKLQQKLSELGYNVGPIDEVFGPRTEAAVMQFQTEKGLDIDGVVGDQTWSALFQESIPRPIASLENPPSQGRCFEVYGDFRIKGWKEQNIVQCDLSMFRSELEHVHVNSSKPDKKILVQNNWFGFECHRLVVPKFQEAFKNVINRNLAKQIKTFNGCHVVRQMAGGKAWSTHSWGISIDLNTEWNRFKQKKFEMSEDLANCFEALGFVWGGRWTGFPDAMHFQYATVR